MGESYPSVDLLVPCYNTAEYLPELLDSIVTQEHTNFQVLIGDDGSTDETAECVRPYLKDPRFQYIRWEKNRGLGAVMKDLMERSSADFWCNPGGDDRLHPDFLKARLAAAAEVSDPLIVHGPPCQIGSKGEPIAHFPVFSMPRHLDASDFLEILLYHNVVNNPGIMVRSKATRRVIPHMRTDLQYAPDWYWWILHASQPGTVVFDETPRMDYRFHGSSLTGSPAKRWVRSEETRRVPLVALQDASEVSPLARQKLETYGTVLRSSWVARLAKTAIGSGFSHPLPDLSILGSTRLAQVLAIARAVISWPVVAIRMKRPTGANGTFTPAGIPFADHRNLSVSDPVIETVGDF